MTIIFLLLLGIPVWFLLGSGIFNLVRILWKYLPYCHDRPIYEHVMRMYSVYRDSIQIISDSHNDVIDYKLEAAKINIHRRSDNSIFIKVDNKTFYPHGYWQKRFDKFTYSLALLRLMKVTHNNHLGIEGPSPIFQKHDIDRFVNEKLKVVK